MPYPGASDTFDAARDDGPQHLVAEVCPHIGGDLVGQLGAAVVHRQDDRGHVQFGIEVRLDHLDVPQQLPHPSRA